LGYVIIKVFPEMKSIKQIIFTGCFILFSFNLCYAQNLLKDNNSKIETILKGKWTFQNGTGRHVEYDSTYIYRKQNSPKEGSLNYFKFDSTSVCIFFIQRNIHSGNLYNCKWYFSASKKNIIIELKEMKTKFTIEYISKDILTGTFSKL